MLFNESSVQNRHGNYSIAPVVCRKNRLFVARKSKKFNNNKLNEKCDKKNEQQNPKVNNNTLIRRNLPVSLMERIKAIWDPFVLVFIIIFLLLFNLWMIYFDAFLCFPWQRFNLQIANYKLTSDNVVFLDTLGLGKTPFAYKIRKNLLNQYKHIYKTNDTNLYNVIGVFKKIDNDFLYLQYSNNNDNRYIQYKKEYLLELEKILNEYTLRKKTSDKFLYSKRIFLGGFTHFIPNRIIFYISLAYSYYIFADLENIEINPENLKKIQDIFNGYETVLSQEEIGKSHHLSFSNDRAVYEDYYYKFEYLYSRKIILMEEKLNPQSFCKNTEIFDTYLTMSNIINLNSKVDRETKLLLKNKCNYKI